MRIVRDADRAFIVWDPHSHMSQAQRGFCHSSESNSHRSSARFMPIKLQVVKEDDDGEPADYLFEQDRITIGRGSGNDLTLPDQKVSTEHAEIRSENGDYHLWDRDSKNKTYVDGRRVGEDEPYVLGSGDVFQVGDFKIEFAPLFMPSSEQTAYAEDSEDANPFERHTRDLASALEGLAETYKFAPNDQREESFGEAIKAHLDLDLGDEEGVQRVLKELGVVSEGSSATASEADSGEADASPPADVVRVLMESVARMVEIPDQFWREFTGTELDHPPERAALHEADPDELRRYLLDDSLSEADRKQRLTYLREAVDSLVEHNMAMLTGYRKAVMTGSKKLLKEVDPTEVEEAASEEGMVDSFLGGGDDSGLDALQKRWKELYQETVENKYFRPTYVETYVDHMAETWDMDRAEILPDEQAG